MRNHSLRWLVVLLSCLIVISAHGQRNKPKKGEPEKPPEPQKVFSEEDFSSIQSYLEPFIYRGDGLRNPFKAPEVVIPLVPGEVYGPFLPLQRYRLDQLIVKGLFWNIKTPKALIQDPKGKMWTIGIKDYVGEDFGYIAAIREKEIVVIQTIEEEGQRYSTTKIMFIDNIRSE